MNQTSRFIRALGSALLLGSTPLGVQPLRGQASVAPPVALRDTAVLEPKVATTDPSAARTATSATAATVTTSVLIGEDGFQVRSLDNVFALKLKGGVQYDGRFFLAADGNATPGVFQLRRVMSDIQGTLYGAYDFRVYLDLASNRLDLLDAYLNAGFSPSVQLRFGKQKVPVGLERLQAPFDGAFAELALPSNLAPNRDIGIQLHGTVLKGAATYAIGAYNGVPDGASDDTDHSNSKDMVGRLFLTPFRPTPLRALHGLGLGVAWSIGNESGTPSLPATPSFRSGGREVFFRYRADNSVANTVVADGRRFRVAPQGYLYWKSLGVLGEYIRTSAGLRRDAHHAVLTNEAWQLATTVVLTGEAASYKGVTPRTAFDPARGAWGAWEVGARLSTLRVDPATFPLFADPERAAQSATAYSASINWYLNRAVRAMASYELTRFGAADTAAPRRTERVLVSRVQVAF